MTTVLFVSLKDITSRRCFQNHQSRIF